MNTILEWLQGGDVRSDGASDQAVEAVLKDNALVTDLIEGLACKDDVVRGRTMDALEKIARVRPHLVMPAFMQILDLLENERTMMVRMHAAMLFGHLVVFNETIPMTYPVLLDMLDDEAVFTKNWAITSLCIIAGVEPDFTEELIQRIAKMQDDPSPAVRTRVRKALDFLTDPEKHIPRGWIKSKRFGIP